MLSLFLNFLLVGCSCEWYQPIDPMNHSQREHLTQVTLTSGTQIYELPLPIPIFLHNLSTEKIRVRSDSSISFGDFVIRIAKSQHNILTALEYWDTITDGVTIKGSVNTTDGFTLDWFLVLSMNTEEFKLEIQTGSPLKSMLCERAGCYQTLLSAAKYSLCEAKDHCLNKLRTCEDESSCSSTYPECFGQGQEDCYRLPLWASIIIGVVALIIHILGIVCCCIRCRRNVSDTIKGMHFSRSSVNQTRTQIGLNNVNIEMQ